MSGETDRAVLRVLRTQFDLAWSLAEHHLERLAPVDLDADAPFPWPPGSGRTIADTLAWANAELTKNVAELGQLRLLHASRAAA